jgi:hypothetical protein
MSGVRSQAVPQFPKREGLRASLSESGSASYKEV